MKHLMYFLIVSIMFFGFGFIADGTQVATSPMSRDANSVAIISGTNAIVGTSLISDINTNMLVMVDTVTFDWTNFVNSAEAVTTKAEINGCDFLTNMNFTVMIQDEEINLIANAVIVKPTEWYIMDINTLEKISACSLITNVDGSDFIIAMTKENSDFKNADEVNFTKVVDGTKEELGQIGHMTTTDFKTVQNSIQGEIYLITMKTTTVDGTDFMNAALIDKNEMVDGTAIELMTSNITVAETMLVNGSTGLVSSEATKDILMNAGTIFV